MKKKVDWKNWTTEKAPTVSFKMMKHRATRRMAEWNYKFESSPKIVFILYLLPLQVNIVDW